MRSCRFLHFETVSTRAPVLSPIPRAHSGAFRPRARPHERRLTRSRSRFSQVFPRRSAKERPSRAFVSRSRRRETNAGENRASRRVSHFDARFGGGAKALSSFVLTTLARLWHPCRLPWRERVGNPTRAPPGPPRSFRRAPREKRGRFRSRVPSVVSSNARSVRARRRERNVRSVLFACGVHIMRIAVRLGRASSPVSRSRGPSADFCNASDARALPRAASVPRSAESGDEPLPAFVEPPLLPDSHRAFAFRVTFRRDYRLLDERGGRTLVRASATGALRAKVFSVLRPRENPLLEPRPHTSSSYAQARERRKSSSRSCTTERLALPAEVRRTRRLEAPGSRNVPRRACTFCREPRCVPPP